MAPVDRDETPIAVAVLASNDALEASLQALSDLGSEGPERVRKALRRAVIGALACHHDAVAQALRLAADARGTRGCATCWPRPATPRRSRRSATESSRSSRTGRSAR